MGDINCRQCCNFNIQTSLHCLCILLRHYKRNKKKRGKLTRYKLILSQWAFSEIRKCPTSFHLRSISRYLQSTLLPLEERVLINGYESKGLLRRSNLLEINGKIRSSCRTTRRKQCINSLSLSKNTNHFPIAQKFGEIRTISTFGKI